MSVEILQPFQLDANGHIATVSDPNLQVDQHLLTLVSTQPGERVMLPNYGIPSFKHLFQMDTTANRQQLLTEAQRAVAAWEPNLTVSLSFGPNKGNNVVTGEIDIQIDWIAANQFNSASSGVVTATVLVGGTVVEKQ
jgi:phage baseplate assembly protein W